MEDDLENGTGEVAQPRAGSSSFRGLEYNTMTVSRDFNIGLNLSNEEDELHRAVELSEEVMKKKKWILILDDLWDSFELHKVGIPVSLKGCFRLIMTTRSARICQRMGSQHKIKVKPLSKREAWTLFMEKLGHDTTLSPELERTAIDVAREMRWFAL
uniref:NB-ARC domain-containing protein n=1 Tax=Salix viminalis TaxID=40686 RepID=A0A6N2KVZ9_SALVM